MTNNLGLFRLARMESQRPPEADFSSSSVRIQVDDLGQFHKFQV
jgi:hypothetical protein